MPITIEYQPSFVTGGQLAYQAGRGRFLQERDRFELAQNQFSEQQRQFDQRLQFAAQEAGLRDDQLRRQMAQQAYFADAQMAQRDRLANRQIDASLAMERVRQQGWRENREAELQAAQQREEAALLRMSKTQQFQNAMAEKQSLTQYMQKNGSVMSPDQMQSLVSQWEQQHGLPWTFSEQAVAEVESARKERYDASLAAAAAKYGIEGDVEPYFYMDDKGNPQFTPLGEFHREQWKINQEHDRLLQRDIRSYESAERIAGLKREEAARKEEASEASKFSSDMARAKTDAYKSIVDWRAKQETGEAGAEPVSGQFNWPVVTSQEWALRNTQVGDVFWIGGKLVYRYDLSEDGFRLVDPRSPLSSMGGVSN